MMPIDETSYSYFDTYFNSGPTIVRISSGTLATGRSGLTPALEAGLLDADALAAHQEALLYDDYFETGCQLGAYEYENINLRDQQRHHRYGGLNDGFEDSRSFPLDVFHHRHAAPAGSPSGGSWRQLRRDDLIGEDPPKRAPCIPGAPHPQATSLPPGHQRPPHFNLNNQNRRPHHLGSPPPLANNFFHDLDLVCIPSYPIPSNTCSHLLYIVHICSCLFPHS